MRWPILCGRRWLPLRAVCRRSVTPRGVRCPALHLRRLRQLQHPCLTALAALLSCTPGSPPLAPATPDSALSALPTIERARWSPAHRASTPPGGFIKRKLFRASFDSDCAALGGDEAAGPSSWGGCDLPQCAGRPQCHAQGELMAAPLNIRRGGCGSGEGCGQGAICMHC